MPDLHSPLAVRGLLQKYGLRPQKALGQNFILNPAVCPKMAEMAGAAPEICALEIGPGLGVLTTQLARRCNKVVAVELDKGLLPLLGEVLAEHDNVQILQGDFLKLDPAALFREHFAGMPVIVCANLPYYITTPLLMHLLEGNLGALGLVSVTAMVQKETARRICAPLPSRQAGAITAAIAWRAQPQVLFDVSRGSFYPPPEVDSSVIKLTLHQSPPVAVNSETLLLRVIRAGFAQRRKTLLNSLSADFKLPKEDLRGVLEGVPLDPGARAEQLSLVDFARLADALGQRFANGL